MKLALLSLLLFFCFAVQAQQDQTAPLTVINSGQDCSIRGMSIPSDNVIWLSGSNGHVARSTDAGKNWKWMTVEGYAKTDFRDIHAIDSSTAVIMGIGNPAHILKTQDGGQSWKSVYKKEMNGMFLDAMDFKNEMEGICIGDPIDAGDGRETFFILRTSDAGESWQQEPSDRVPAAQEGEAVFSASGTNIALLNSKEFDYAFISGGIASNLYLIGRKNVPNKAYPLQIEKGKETTGAFSMATDRNNKFYCIGGDYAAPDSINNNFVWSTDGGHHWKAPAGTPPSGYRSCIRTIDHERLVACGTNGVDICRDPNKWMRISNEGFNVCMVSPNKKLIFFGGAKGRIGVMNL